jgi:hypothetical protein
MSTLGKRKPLTERQRIAIERRQEQREIRDQLKAIERALDFIPEGRRGDALGSLWLILGNGWLFTRACGKAASMYGHLGKRRNQFWAFVDKQNAEFAEAYKTDVAKIDRWNGSLYPTLATFGDQQLAKDLELYSAAGHANG